MLGFLIFPRRSPSQSNHFTLISISDFILRSALQHIDTKRLLFGYSPDCNSKDSFMESMSLPLEIQLLLISEPRKSSCSEFGTTKQWKTRLYKCHPLATEFSQMIKKRP